MNTRQFEYILAVAKLKNFGLAADECYITQSTLSTMIGRFEEEIGIRIFDRKTKPITITKEGEEIISQLKLINKDISILKDVVQNLKGEMVGDLKIGVIPTIAPYLLPEFLNDFAKAFPGMNFKVSEMTTEFIEDHLEKRELDIGIVAIPINNSQLVEMPLYNEPFVLFDCTDHPQKEVHGLESVDYSNFWLLEEGHCLHTQVSSICDAQSNVQKHKLNLEFRAGSIESLIRFVKTNKGRTLLPHLACRSFLPDEYQNLTYFNAPVPVRTIGLLVHRHFTKQLLLKELKHTIQEKISPLIQSGDEEFVVVP